MRCQPQVCLTTIKFYRAKGKSQAKVWHKKGKVDTVPQRGSLVCTFNEMNMIHCNVSCLLLFVGSYHIWKLGNDRYPLVDIEYPLSENAYIRVKMNEDSNENRISGKDSILHEIPYPHSCLYAFTISLVSSAAHIAYFCNFTTKSSQNMEPSS